jgi:hypothetical protein
MRPNTASDAVARFSGWEAQPYAVQASTNLVDWVSVSTNYPANGAFEFNVSAPAGQARRFYRTWLQPGAR